LKETVEDDEFSVDEDFEDEFDEEMEEPHLKPITTRKALDKDDDEDITLDDIAPQYQTAERKMLEERFEQVNLISFDIHLLRSLNNMTMMMKKMKMIKKVQVK
jgi:hypothetical protein